MKKLIKYLIIICEALLIWSALSVLLNKACLPKPIITLKTCFILLINGTFNAHILASLNRILLGTFFGTAFAIPFGLALGYSKCADFYIGGLFNLLYTIPKVVFLPVIVVLLGIGDLPKIFLIALVLFFQETVVIRDATKKIQIDMINLMNSMGAGNYQKLVHLILPYCLPDIITSLRASLGASIALLFITENFASISGLGYYITQSMNQRNYNNMYSGIIVLSIMGVALYNAFGVLEKALCRWNKYI